MESEEILDDIMTRSRGEIRHTYSPKVTSSTPGSQDDMKPAYSPRASRLPYSPRTSELRAEQSPHNGMQTQKRGTPSPGPSKLGQSSSGSTPS